MKNATKIKAIIGITATGAWVSLFTLFYFAEPDYAPAAEINFGKIRGASASRFKLDSDEVVLWSSHSDAKGKGDVLLMSSKSGSDDVIVRVLRGTELVFEQKFAEQYNTGSWNPEKMGFEIGTKKQNDIFLLKLEEDKYNLVW